MEPSLKQQARQFLKYDESREGYWTSAKFMLQMEIAVDIAEVKYPKEDDGWQYVWVFDQSSCHKNMFCAASSRSNGTVRKTYFCCKIISYYVYIDGSQ